MEKQKKMDSSTNHEQQQATSKIGDLACGIECDLGCELVRDIESLDANIIRHDSLGEPISSEESVLSSQDIFDDKNNDVDDYDYVELDHIKDITTSGEDNLQLEQQSINDEPYQVG